MLGGNVPLSEDKCKCGDLACYHQWATFQNGRVVSLPSKCRVVGCDCQEFRLADEQFVQEQQQSAAKEFDWLQSEGISSDVAQWLLNLKDRVEQLEKLCRKIK